MYRRLLVKFLFFFGLAFSLEGQINFSPYSRFGLGDRSDGANTGIFSMGSTGYAMSDPAAINRLNPASYGDLKLTTFDFTGYYGTKLLRTNASSLYANYGGFQNASIGFSNKKNWGLVIGLAPYTSSAFSVEVRNAIMVDTSMQAYTTRYKTTGGMSMAYVGAGVKFFNKLNIGVNANIMMGNTTHLWITDFDNADFQPVQIRHRIASVGFVPQPGIQYTDTLKIKTTTNLVLDLSKTYKDLLKQEAEQTKAIGENEKTQGKLDGEKGKTSGEIKELKGIQERLDKQITTLMENERLNEKEIGKKQELKFRLDKKIRKMDQKISSKQKKLDKEKARVAAELARIKKEEVQVDKRKTNVMALNPDSTVQKVNKMLFRVGGIYEPGMGISGNRLIEFNNLAVKDTLGDELKSPITLPSRIGTGISFGVPNHWTVGADVCLTNWSQVRYFDQPNTLQNSLRISIGGEYIPKMYGSNYKSRIAWRAGAWFEKTNLVINGTQINDFGVSFGIGLPAGRNWYLGAVSRMSIGVVLGHKGTLKNNLVDETYVGVRFGVNLNDVWFIRQKVD